MVARLLLDKNNSCQAPALAPALNAAIGQIRSELSSYENANWILAESERTLACERKTWGYNCMALGHQSGFPGTVSLFADASNLMHSANDIPAIMRVAVTTAIQLVNANAAAAGLRIDDQLAWISMVLKR